MKNQELKSWKLLFLSTDRERKRAVKGRGDFGKKNQEQEMILKVLKV